MTHHSSTRLDRCIRRFDRLMRQAESIAWPEDIEEQPLTYLYYHRLMDWAIVTEERHHADMLCDMLTNIQIETSIHGNQPADLHRLIERQARYMAWRTNLGIEPNTADVLADCIIC